MKFQAFEERISATFLIISDLRRPHSASLFIMTITALYCNE